jgi:hypothetical protein
VSLALADNGQVALGDANDDACCDSAGVATWRFGSKPPVLAELSPQHAAEEVHDTPQVAMDERGRVVAAWTADGPEPHPESEQSFEHVQVARAEHRGYVVQTLFRASYRMSDLRSFGLQQGGSGQAVLNWITELGVDGPKAYAFAANTEPNGMWSQVKRSFIPAYSPLEQFTSNGFATDTDGDQALLYEREESQLSIVRRPVGDTFGPRLRIDGPTEDATIAAGGDDTVLVAWVPRHRNVVTVAIGNLTGSLEAPRDLAATIPNHLKASVDDRGRAILIWDSETIHNHRNEPLSSVWLAAAGANRGLIAPVLLSNPHHNCKLGGGEQEIVASPNGHALLFWTCGKHLGDDQTRYMARYTP